MKTLFSTEILRATTKKGTYSYWRGHIEQDAQGQIYTCAEYWQDTKDGESEHQFSEPVLILPKNVGKKNETTPLDQAHSELAATIKKLRDKKGYRGLDEAEDANAIILPMLAEKYLESSDSLLWPVYVQPKLDGHRAIFDGTRFTTRGGQEHKPHIHTALGFDSCALVLDGELMLDPTSPPCQGLSKVERYQLSSKTIKKDYPELTPWLRYYVYDIVRGDRFTDRYVKLLATANHFPAQIVVVETRVANDDTQVMTLFRDFLDLGYEGAMIRDNSGGYDIGNRSRQLQKLKPFDDEEFEIVDVVPSGRGKAATVGKFRCRTKAGVEFEANPKGTLELRQSYLQNRDQLIGKHVTVHFEGYTKDGKPRCPRAIAVREVWDK